MSQLQQNLGNGIHGIVEIDYITRLLKGEVYDTEEVRIDKPSDYLNSYEYIGIATVGTLTSATEWYIARKTWVNNRPVRILGRDNISWDNRTIGWPA